MDKTRSRKAVARRYVQLLEQGNIALVIQLFTINGIVQSPIYGTQRADDFYRQLAKDTYRSELSIKNIFEEETQPKLALYFEYVWTLRSGKVVRFDVVDILEFDEENNIQKLTIIYDTVVSRQLVKEL
jgi:hypothetical protein